jgi:phosphoribosylaminoimidazolecarboxamide formyltransferase / IMP cyclohydrolase
LSRAAQSRFGDACAHVEPGLTLRKRCERIVAHRSRSLYRVTTKPRALLSVYDKTGIIEFASALVSLNYELVSSGGTSAALAEAGIAHITIDALTEFPEMLDGRVKTLHPRVHAGILADRSKDAHMAVIAEHDIAPIDLVVCNLYPFTSNPSIELIDVGGPSMVRGAAKNYAHVGVVVDPASYDAIVAELKTKGSLVDTTRLALARDAFAHTAAYDAAIAAWFQAQAPTISESLPAALNLSLELASVLRYGENPHQGGARYRFAGQTSWWDSAEQLGGKELSYLNVYDADAAWRLVHDVGFEGKPSVAIIKHANPCGAASASSVAKAYQLANACDPVSAFGGIVAINQTVTKVLAEHLAPVFTEVVIAPDYDADALEVLLAKKNMRVLRAVAPSDMKFDLRSIDGGLLLQDVDDVTADLAEKWQVVTTAVPTPDQMSDLRFGWIVCGHVKSNAIVLARDEQAIGVGAGQQSRVDSAQIAIRKAGERAANAICASDAFFPFRDGVDLLIAAGVKAIVQPGGSVRDDEVIAACDEAGVAMVFTGRRHFRH